MRHTMLALTALFAALTACNSAPDTTIQSWQTVWDLDYLPSQGINGALLSVWGAADNDVWMVGGAQEVTPTTPVTILNWNGTSWARLNLKVLGTLWWITGDGKGIFWMAGKDGLVIRWSRPDNAYSRQNIPSKLQLWGILAFSDTDVWAVGGEPAQCSGTQVCGAIWHYDGATWTSPTGLPAGWNTTPWFKVFARGPNDVFICGMSGHILHWDGSAWKDDAVVSSSLLTGSCNGSLCVAVGGAGGTGVIAEHDGTKWRQVMNGTPIDMLNGVAVRPDGSAIAVGYPYQTAMGIWRRTVDGVWSADPEAPQTSSVPTPDHDLDTRQAYHAVWIDSVGDAWAVGGDLAQPTFSRSMLAHYGVPIPAPVTASQ